MPMPTGSRKTERVYVAATKASPATDEPGKRTATKTPAKKAPAKRAAKAPAAKAAAKAAPKKAPAKRAANDPATKPEDLNDDLETTDDLEAEPGDDLDVEDTDLELDEDLDTDDESVEDDAEDSDEDDEEAEEAEDAGEEASAAKAPAAKPAGTATDEEDIAEPSEKDKASGDFVWDEEESEALRQARKDAELTASADSVRAYLKQIGKVALLNAEEEVELAKRIEAGLYATQLMAEKAAKGEKFTPTE